MPSPDSYSERIKAMFARKARRPDHAILAPIVRGGMWLNNASPRKRVGAMLDMTPVIGGAKGAVEDFNKGDYLWSAVNAATVPLDLWSMGFAGPVVRQVIPKQMKEVVGYAGTRIAAMGIDDRVNALMEIADQRSPINQTRDGWVLYSFDGKPAGIYASHQEAAAQKATALEDFREFLYDKLTARKELAAVDAVNYAETSRGLVDDE